MARAHAMAHAMLTTGAAVAILGHANTCTRVELWPTQWYLNFTMTPDTTQTMTKNGRRWTSMICRTRWRAAARLKMRQFSCAVEALRIGSGRRPRRWAGGRKRRDVEQMRLLSQCRQRLSGKCCIMPAYWARAQARQWSPLQLAFEFVQEAPSRSTGAKFRWELT